MIDHLTSRLRPSQAAAVLAEVFGSLSEPFAFRLWDGTEVPIGAGDPAFTVVIPSPATFLRVVRDPSPLNFAEAYVEAAIDIEGDLFAAMRVANDAERLTLAPLHRLRVLATLWRG